jgi:hypothetical protein
MGWEFCFIRRMVKKEDKLVCKTVTACGGYVWLGGWRKHLIPYFNMRDVQKVSSDGLLKIYIHIYYKPCILPFDVHTVHYFST